MSMNYVFQEGRVCQHLKIEMGKTKIFTRFSLAVGGTNRDDADYFNCMAFDRVAENLVKRADKGSRLLVVGKLKSGHYINKDNNKVPTVTIMIGKVDIIDMKDKQKSNDFVDESDFEPDYAIDPDIPY